MGAALMMLAACMPAQALNERRYLLILTATVDDPRVKAQGAEIARLEAEGDDRDLEIVLIAEKGSGVLSRRGRFETVLLGKDGGVKRRSPKVMGAADLKATIDAMPMRRQEMLRRAGAKKVP